MPNTLPISAAAPSRSAAVAGQAITGVPGQPTLQSVSNRPFDVDTRPTQACSPAVLAACSSVLNKPGKFSVVEDHAGQHYLVHRSRDLALVAQPIVPAENGGVRVALRPESRSGYWVLMGQRFSGMDEVRQTAGIFMTEVPVGAASPSSSASAPVTAIV
jgi:hypothetical protein